MPPLPCAFCSQHCWLAFFVWLHHQGSATWTFVVRSATKKLPGRSLASQGYVNTIHMISMCQDKR
eukprot:1158557-Pelagomonas_calceolata.AAC.5